MEADSQFALSQITQVNEELCIQRIDRTFSKLHGVQRFKTIDDGFIQSETDADRLYRIAFQPRVMNARTCRVTRQYAKQKKVQHKDEQNREN
jgi:hypothetical protein